MCEKPVTEGPKEDITSISSEKDCLNSGLPGAVLDILNACNGSQEEAFTNGFLREFNSFIENTGIRFGKKIIAKLFEESGSGFERRFGNGFAAFTRSISLYIHAGLLSEIFDEIPSKDVIDNVRSYEVDNPYFMGLLKQIVSIFDDSHPSEYDLYESGQNKRDKSCKDAEAYFSFLISKKGGNNKIENFRIIGDFIEKNVDGFQAYEEKRDSIRTAISRKDISVKGIFYPRGYLFRLNTKENNVISVEPLRMTILGGGDKTSDFGSATFGSQFEDFNDSYNIKDGEDIIDTLEKVLET